MIDAVRRIFISYAHDSPGHMAAVRTLHDLLGTLAWVRELVSMIHLAKFTGAPASRAEELVAQIAAAVEGLSALTWQEETAPRPQAPLPIDG